MVGKALRTGGLVLPSDAADTGSGVFQGRDSLSETEARILGLVKQGKTNRQIAAAQGISPTTVNAYLIRIGLKLRTSGRAAAVEEAENRGIDLTGEPLEARSTPDDPASGENIGHRPIGSRPHDTEGADAAGPSEFLSATTVPDGFRPALSRALWGPQSSIESADAAAPDTESRNHSPRERSVLAVLDYVAGATSGFVASAVSEGLEASVVEAIRGLDPADLEAMLVDLGAARSDVEGVVARFTRIQRQGAIPSAAPSAVPDVDDYLVRVSAPDGSDSWRTRRLVRRIMENWAHAGEVGWPDTDQVDSAELLVSELAGNIARHAGTHGFVIAAVTEGPGGPVIRVGVRDYSRTLPAWRNPDGNVESGRGGRLLTMLATDYGVVEHVDGKTVWFELRGERPGDDRAGDDDLDRLSTLFPDLGDDSTAPPSGGPEGRIGSAPHSPRATGFPALLTEGLNSGVVRREALPKVQGVMVERVTFGNGYQSDREVYDKADDAAKQWLTSLIGGAMGAPVAATHPANDDPTVLYREIVPGRAANTVLPQGMSRAYDLGLVNDDPASEGFAAFGSVDRSYLDSASGELLGLLDAVTGTRRSTRHWNIGPDGEVTGGRTALDSEQAGPSPFATKFTRYVDGRPVWQGHGFPRTDITGMREQVSYLQDRLRDFSSAQEAMLLDTHSRVMTELGRAERYAVHTPEETVHVGGLSADAQAKARLVEEFNLNHPYFVITGFNHPRVPVDAVREILETLDDLLTRYRHAPDLVAHMSNIRELRIDFLADPGVNAETLKRGTRSKWMTLNLSRVADRAQALEDDLYDRSTGFHPASGRSYHDDVIHEFGHAIDHATGNRLSREVDGVLRRAWAALRIAALVAEPYEEWLERLPEAAFTDETKTTLRPPEAIAVGFAAVEIDGPVVGSPQWVIHQFVTILRPPEISPDLVVNLLAGETKSGTATTADQSGADDVIGSRPHDPEKTESADTDIPRSAPIGHDTDVYREYTRTKGGPRHEAIFALTAAIRSGEVPPHPSATSDISALSGREQQILKLLTERLSRLEIAELLGVTRSFVNTAVQRTVRKLGARSDAEAVAMTLGVLDRIPTSAAAAAGQADPVYVVNPPHIAAALSALPGLEREFTRAGLADPRGEFAAAGADYLRTLIEVAAYELSLDRGAIARAHLSAAFDAGIALLNRFPAVTEIRDMLAPLHRLRRRLIEDPSATATTSAELEDDRPTRRILDRTVSHLQTIGRTEPAVGFKPLAGQAQREVPTDTGTNAADGPIGHRPSDAAPAPLDVDQVLQWILDSPSTPVQWQPVGQVPDDVLLASAADTVDAEVRRAARTAPMRGQTTTTPRCAIAELTYTAGRLEKLTADDRRSPVRVPDAEAARIIELFGIGGREFAEYAGGRYREYTAADADTAPLAPLLEALENRGKPTTLALLTVEPHRSRRDRLDGHVLTLGVDENGELWVHEVRRNADDTLAFDPDGNVADHIHLGADAHARLAELQEPDGQGEGRIFHAITYKKDGQPELPLRRSDNWSNAEWEREPGPNTRLGQDQPEDNPYRVPNNPPATVVPVARIRTRLAELQAAEQKNAPATERIRQLTEFANAVEEMSDAAATMARTRAETVTETQRQSALATVSSIATAVEAAARDATRRDDAVRLLAGLDASAVPQAHLVYAALFEHMSDAARYADDVDAADEREFDRSARQYESMLKLTDWLDALIAVLERVSPKSRSQQYDSLISTIPHHVDPHAPDASPLQSWLMREAIRSADRSTELGQRAAVSEQRHRAAVAAVVGLDRLLSSADSPGGRPGSEPIGARPSRTEYDGAELVRKFHPEVDEFWKRLVEVVVLDENEEGSFIGPDGEPFTTGRGQNCFLILRSGKIVTTKDGSGEHPNLLYSYIETHADENERRIYNKIDGPSIVAGGGIWRLADGRPEIIMFFSGLFIEHATRSPKFWAQARHRLSQNFDLSTIFIEYDNLHVGGAWQNPPENEDNSAEKFIRSSNSFQDRPALSKKVAEHLRGGNEEFWFEVENVGFPHDGGLSIDAIVHPVLGEPAAVTIDIGRGDTPEIARYRHFDPGPEPERTVPAFRVVHETLTQWLGASGIAITAPIEGPTDVIGARPDQASGNRDDTVASAPTPWQQRPGGSFPAIGARPSNGAAPDGTEAFRRQPDGAPWSRRTRGRGKNAQSTATHRPTESPAAPSTENPLAQRAIATLTEYFGANATERTLVQTVDPDDVTGASTAHTEKVAQWWESLGTGAPNRSGLPQVQKELDLSDEQYDMLRACSWLIGNADGIPYSVRDRANRLAIEERIDQFLERRPDRLRRFRTTLTAAERAELRNLLHLRDQLPLIEKTAAGLTGGPRVQVVAFDPAAHGENGRVIVSIGDLDNAEIINMMANGFGSTTEMLYHRSGYAMSLNEMATLRADGAAVATIGYIGYHCPTDASVAVPRKAADGGDMLACDITAVHATRAHYAGRDGGAPMPRLFNAVGHSYGSTTTCYAGRGGRLAGVIDHVILTGSPGIGWAVRHADDFGVPVWVLGEPADPVAQLGSTALQEHRAGIDIGLGLAPTSAEFGATVLTTEVPAGPKFAVSRSDRLDRSVFKPHASYYLWHDWPRRIPARALDNIGWVAVGRGDLAEVRQPHAADRRGWLRARSTGRPGSSDRSEKSPGPPQSPTHPDEGADIGSRPRPSTSTPSRKGPPIGAAPTEYAVATPVRPDAYQPHMAEDVRVRKLIVRDGLFCDSDGTPHNSDDFEYFLIGVQPDDFRVVGPGDFPDDEVDDDSYDFVHPHDIVFCSYADPGDGPIGAGYWRRMVNGIPRETLLTCRAFPDTLEERVKFVMQTLHWLSEHGMDLAALNLSGTFHGTIFRLPAPLHSAAELISQDYAHPESVFACATTQFWVYPTVVESTPARLSVSLPVTLLNGTRVEHTITLTRHGDTITASFTEPTLSPVATEAAAAWTQLRSELIDPWLANSNVVATQDPGAIGAKPSTNTTGDGRPDATVSKRELLVVNKPFTKLLFGEKFLPGEFVNQIGTAAASSGLTYVLLGRGESTTTTAMAAAALWVPGAFELLAGYAADFWKPEKVVNSALWVGSAAATTAAGLVLADASHLGAALTAATLVEATAGTFYTGTFLNEMRNLLTKSQLDSGNRLITSTGSAAGITGSALGAGLAGVAPAAPFGLNALSYWGNLANVRGFVFPPRARRQPRNLFREIGDGVRALRREKFLTQHTAFATINNAAFAMMGLRTATVLTDAGLPGWALSAAATAPAVGGILSGFLPKALDRINATTFYPAALASMAGFFTLMASTTDPAVIASASLVDATVMAAAGNRVTKYAQDAFPDDLQGRAMSARRLFLKSGPALGFLGAAAVANAHGGQGSDAMAGIAAAATALTATGYSALLLVRRGRVSLRVITRGRGWLGRLSRARQAEPAEAERAATNATRPTETSDEPAHPAEDSRVYHRLLAQLGDPRTARDLAARAHARAEREQPPTDPDAAAEHLLHIADTIIAEHRSAMAQLDDVVGDQPAPRQQRLAPFQHGGVFFHNQPDEPQAGVGSDDVPAEPNPHRLTGSEIEIAHERGETERARVDLARALGVDPRVLRKRGALLQVLDQVQTELRLLDDEAWSRIRAENLPGWLGRALDREYRAQRAMSDGATAEELARLDADTRQLDADLPTILGQDQLAPGWRAADSDDKLHELRLLATRANAPQEIADLVDAAARFLGLARPTPPATDSPAAAAAHASIHTEQPDPGAIGAKPAPTTTGEGQAGHRIGWRQRRVSDDVEIARHNYHRPQTRAAVVAVLERTFEVLQGLFPEASLAQILETRNARENQLWGGMVPSWVSWDELRDRGNLRELMCALLNVMIRNAELRHGSTGFTLDEGIARLLNRPDWRDTASRLRLDQAALERVRNAFPQGWTITAADLREVRFTRMRNPGADAAFEEYEQRKEISRPRSEAEQRRRHLTSGDLAALGMELSPREFAGLIERPRVLRIEPLDLESVELRYNENGRVDTEWLESQLKSDDADVEYVVPTYVYDDRGKHVRDSQGHCLVASVQVHHHDGYIDPINAGRLDPARYTIELPWRQGSALVELDPDSDYFRSTLAESESPFTAGISGSATRMLARFRWLGVLGVAEDEFIRAMAAFILPHHHSVFEFEQGLRIEGASLAGDPTVPLRDGDLDAFFDAALRRFGPSERTGRSSTATDLDRPGEGSTDSSESPEVSSWWDRRDNVPDTFLPVLRIDELETGSEIPRDQRGMIDVEALESRLRTDDPTVFSVAVTYHQDERGSRIGETVHVHRRVGFVDRRNAHHLDPKRFVVPGAPGRHTPEARGEHDPKTPWNPRSAPTRPTVPVTSPRGRTPGIWVDENLADAPGRKNDPGMVFAADPNLGDEARAFGRRNEESTESRPAAGAQAGSATPWASIGAKPAAGRSERTAELPGAGSLESRAGIAHVPVSSDHLKVLLWICQGRTVPEITEALPDKGNASTYIRELASAFGIPTKRYLIAAEGARRGLVSVHAPLTDLREVLTPRQIVVLAHLSRGLSRREIADKLSVSIRTVDEHVERSLPRVESPSLVTAMPRIVGALDAFDEDELTRLAESASGPAALPGGGQTAGTRLSAEEATVLRLVGRGLTYSDIATETGMVVREVRRALARARRKVGDSSGRRAAALLEEQRARRAAGGELRAARDRVGSPVPTPDSETTPTAAEAQIPRRSAAGAPNAGQIPEIGDALDLPRGTTARADRTGLVAHLSKDPTIVFADDPRVGDDGHANPARRKGEQSNPDTTAAERAAAGAEANGSLLRLVRNSAEARTLFSGQLVAEIGTSASQNALTLLMMGIDPQTAAIVAGLSDVPRLVLAPYMGYLADTIEPTRMMNRAKWVMFGASAVAAATSGFQTPYLVPTLIGANLVNTAADTLYGPAAFRVNRAIIGSGERLQQGLSQYNAFVTNLSRTIGNSFAGALEPWLLFGFDSAASGVNVAGLRRIRELPPPPKQTEPQSFRDRLRQVFIPGFEALNQDKILRNYTWNLVVTNGYLGAQHFFFIHSLTAAGLSGGQTSAAFILPSIGGIIGNFFPKRWLSKVDIHKLLAAKYVGLTGMAASALITAVTNDPYIGGAGYAAGWVALGATGVRTNAYFSQNVPEDRLGRASSFLNVSRIAAYSLAGLAGGTLIANQGATPTAIGMTAAMGTITAGSVIRRFDVLGRARYLAASLGGTYETPATPIHHQVPTELAERSTREQLARAHVRSVDGRWVVDPAGRPAIPDGTYTVTFPTDDRGRPPLGAAPALRPNTGRRQPARGAVPPTRNEIADALDAAPRRVDADPAIGTVPGGVTPWSVTRFEPGRPRNPKQPHTERSGASHENPMPLQAGEATDRVAEDGEIGSAPRSKETSSDVPAPPPRSLVVGSAARMYAVATAQLPDEPTGYGATLDTTTEQAWIDAHNSSNRISPDTTKFYDLPNDVLSEHLRLAEIAVRFVHAALDSGTDISTDDFLEDLGSRIHNGRLQRHWRIATPEQRLPFDDPGYPEELREQHRRLARAARDSVVAAGAVDRAVADPFAACTTGAAVAAELWDRHAVDMFGIDIPGVTVELVRDLARAIHHLLTKYPHVQLLRIGFGPIPETRPLAVSDHVAGSGAGYPITRSITVSDIVAADRARFAAEWAAMIDSGRAVGAAEKPMLGLVRREFGYALNAATRRTAQRDAKTTLIDHHEGSHQGATAWLPSDAYAWSKSQFRHYGPGADGRLDGAAALAGAFSAMEHDPEDTSVGEQVLHNLLTTLAPQRQVGRDQLRQQLAAEYRPATPAEQQAKSAMAAALLADHGIEIIGLDNPGITAATAGDLIAGIRHMIARFPILDEVSKIRIAPGDIGEFGHASVDAVEFNEWWMAAPARMHDDAIAQLAAGRLRVDLDRVYFCLAVHELAHLLRRHLPDDAPGPYEVVRQYFRDRYGSNDIPALRAWMAEQFSSYGIRQEDGALDTQEAEAESVVAAEVDTLTPTEGEAVLHNKLSELAAAEAERRDSTPPEPRIGSRPSATAYAPEPDRLAAELLGFGPSFDYIDDLLRIAAGEQHGPAWIDSPDYWDWQLNWLGERGPRLSVLAAFSAAALEAEAALGLPNTSGRRLLLEQPRPRTPGELLPVYKYGTMWGGELEQPSGPDTAAHASAIGRVQRDLSLDELPQYPYLAMVAARPILQVDRDLTRKLLRPEEFRHFDPIPRDGVYGLNYPGCRALDRQTPAYFRARYAGDSLLPMIACRPVYDRFLNHWIEPYQLRHAMRLRDGFQGTTSVEGRIAQWFTSTVAEVLAAGPDAAPEILDDALRTQLRRTRPSTPANERLRLLAETTHELLGGDYDFGHYLRRRDHPETEGYIRTVRETVLRRHPAAAVARVPFLANIIDATGTGTALRTPNGSAGPTAPTGERHGGPVRESSPRPIRR
nr:MFS transporter [Nocardia sp. BSTN01]